MFDIDYVFPWVNDMDPVWKNTYINYCRSHNDITRLGQIKRERYRDWGLLKFLLRAIAKNMPWIRKLHLIVSNIEQVPQWVNQEQVHIVLHEQIMPAQCRPTFNSTTIEMFLPNIPDLAEHFIYGNDDIYPLLPTEPTDWFTESGIPCYNMREIVQSKIQNKQFRVVCANQWWKLQKLLNQPVDKKYYKRPWHGLVPMVVSKCNEVLDLIGRENILKTTSAFRKDTNMNQYIYTDYLDLIGYRQNGRVEFNYINIKIPTKMLLALESSKAHVVCINDCAISTTPMQLAQTQILCAKIFEKRFPEKCKYEN